ncbi:helix-turn-helix domain-containing protein [Streptomyces lavendulae]|uniref:helix-turn-helix domain-containing protein n=1 Tax=Streptomyces lavendulae TaxID=1914 RepID=UPI003825A155
MLAFIGSVSAGTLPRLRGSRSVRDEAPLASCGKTYVSDLETGKQQPTHTIAAALDQALGARGELTALADIRPGSSPTAVLSEPTGKLRPGGDRVRPLG